MATALYPGSFDPITLGHHDIVLRARALFDEVIVLVAHNSSKQPLLTASQRTDLVQRVFADVDGVSVRSDAGLLAEFARDNGVTALVKGLRGGADLDAELPMALMNRHLTGVETVFLPSDPAYAHIASSLVKDVAAHGGRIDDLVPEPVIAPVLAALADRQAALGRPAGVDRQAEAEEPTEIDQHAEAGRDGPGRPSKGE